MGDVDMERQALNVFRMRLLGADVRPASSGSRTLKDAINEALRDWVATVDSTHYCLGSAMGPHPYPFLVRELQRVVGDEARDQARALLDAMSKADGISHTAMLEIAIREADKKRGIRAHSGVQTESQSDPTECD